MKFLSIILVLCLFLTSCAGAVAPSVYQPASQLVSSLSATDAMKVIEAAYRGVNGTLIMQNSSQEVYLFAQLFDTHWKVVMVTKAPGNREMISQLRYAFDNFSNVFSMLAKQNWLQIESATPAVATLIKGLWAIKSGFIAVPVGIFKNILYPKTVDG